MEQNASLGTTSWACCRGAEVRKIKRDYEAKSALLRDFGLAG